MKVDASTPQTVTATASTSDATQIRDLRAPQVESALRLENLLPSEFWKRVQRELPSRELANRIDGELLGPLSFDRENLSTVISRLKSPEGFDRAQLNSLFGEVRECVERLGNIDHQMAVEISRGPGWARPSFDLVRRGLGIENSRLYGDLNAEFRRRYGGLAAEPAATQDLTPAQLAPEDRPFVRMRDNPLRSAISEGTLYAAGMPTKTMAGFIQGMVTKTLPLSLDAQRPQIIASNNTGEHSSVASGYLGPNMYPDLEDLTRKLQGIFRLNAPTAAQYGARLDLSTLTTPIGIVDIAVREPEKMPGVAGRLTRMLSAPHRNVEITIVAPSEIEDRGHERISSKGIVIALNLAVPQGVAERIQHEAEAGKSLEMLRDLFENPPPGRAGSIIKWVRSGIIAPSLAVDGETSPSWERATNAQKNRAFEMFAGTHNGRTRGEFSSKLAEFCRAHAEPID